MKAYAVTLAVALGCVASSALAGEEEAALVQCAWSKVPTTANTLVQRAKFDARYRYDADGSPTVGPLMRIWAACAGEKESLRATAGNVDIRKFLKKLRAAKPDVIAADRFDIPVFRCEMRFSDAVDSAQPAAIGWGYGRDLTAHQLYYSSSIMGHQQAITATLLDDGDALAALLRSAEMAGDSAVEVETRAQGEALGEPYRVKDGGGNRRCQFIQPDGSYSDA